LKNLLFVKTCNFQSTASCSACKACLLRQRGHCFKLTPSCGWRL